MTVLQHLLSTESVTSEEFDEANLVLRSNWAVDLPHNTDEMLRLAESDEFKSGAAGAPMLRPAFWMDAKPAIETYRHVIRHIASEAPLQLEHWISQASIGYISRPTHRTTSESVASLALITTIILEFEPEAFAAIVRGARRGMSHSGGPDPLEDIALGLASVLTTNLGPQLGAQQIRQTRLCSLRRRSSGRSRSPPNRDPLTQ